MAFVTADLAISREDVDLPLILEALTQRGVGGAGRVWTDPSVPWESFDLVVMRSPWDYPERHRAFLDWLARVRAVTTVRNCPELLAWNIDKHYLLELSAAGVPCVNTTVCTSMAEVDMALGAIPDGRVVVKPAVSAGARRTGLFDSGDPAASVLARSVVEAGDVLLVQPAVSTVASSGETALVFFEGAFSHACSKGPILADGGGLLGGHYRERLAALEARPDQLAVATAAMAAAVRAVVSHGCTCADPTPLYGRIDLVDDGERGPVVLEAELFEPSYFLDHAAPSAVSRFADALCRQLAAS